MSPAGRAARPAGRATARRLAPDATSGYPPPVRINADFTQIVRLRAAELPWTASPSPGVERRLLDRVGAEVARATSLVRYAAGSRFPPHVHHGGEEFLVLAGTFEDDEGVYPAGTYVRNPPGTSHAPWTREGCELFVKLRQFDPADRERRVIDTTVRAAFTPGEVQGATHLLLHRFADERVSLERWDAGAASGPLPCPGGAELLVLSGRLDEPAGPAGTWLRVPPGATLELRAAEPTLFYWKQGHLRGLS